MPIIKEQTSLNRKDKLLGAIIISLFMSILIAMGADINFLIFLVVFIILTLLFLLFNMLDNYTSFDGWKIENDSIILIRTNFIKGGFLNKKIDYKQIDEINYSKGYVRVPPSLSVITKDKTYYLLPDDDITKLAKTLKYFQNQGIKISLSQKNEQIERYLNLGKTDD